MALLAKPDFRHELSERSGLADDELAAWAITDPQAAVRHDVELLLTSPLATSRLVVSGHVLDLAIGLVRIAVPSTYPQPCPPAVDAKTIV